jgi:hypothetical protein
MKINQLMQVVFVSGALSAAVPAFAHSVRVSAAPASGAEASQPSPLCGGDSDDDDDDGSDDDGDDDGEETLAL